MGPPGAFLLQLVDEIEQGTADEEAVRLGLLALHDRILVWKQTLEALTDPPNAPDLARLLKLRVGEGLTCYEDAVQALHNQDLATCRALAQQGDDRILLLRRLLDEAIEGAMDEEVGGSR